jgi:hypothetical protein
MIGCFKVVAGLGAVVFALLSAYCWIRAAYAKVASTGNAGVGYGGSPVNVKDHTGAVLDFLKTYALQSRWNSWAALTSGIAAAFGAVAAALNLLL